MLRSVLKLLVLCLALWAASGRKHKPRQLFRQYPLVCRVAYAGVCKENPPDVRFDNATIINIDNNVFVNAFFGVTRQLKPIEKAIVTIRRCASPAEEKNCELFHTWRFGKETCFLMEQKSQIWSGIFQAFHPPLKCPIPKGDYKILNATLDADIVEKSFGGLLEKYFWRIRIDVYDYKMFTCIIFGADFVRQRQATSSHL